MVYVFENPENYASVVYDDRFLTAEEKAQGIAVEVLPEYVRRDDKKAVLKCRKETGEVWYDYEDIPAEISVAQYNELKAQLELTQQAVDDLLLAGGAI